VSFFSFSKLENRRTEQVLWGVAGTSGRGRMKGKGVGEWIWCKCCIHIYVSGKNDTLRLSQEGGGIKEDDGGGEYNYDVFDILQELL
jgi:hypothetical protein